MFEDRSNAHVRSVLGSRLSAFRRSRRLSQQELADRAGLSRPTLSKLERGHDVNLDSLLATLRALDLLDGLDLLVPEPVKSPIAQLGRVGMKRPEPAAWTWGDGQ